MLAYEYCRMLNRLRIHHGETEILFLTGVSKEQAQTIYRGMNKLLEEVVGSPGKGCEGCDDRDAVIEELRDLVCSLRTTELPA